ncbi:MAG: alpha/beta hydrolase [Anaerolineae bacterium]|jgi:pimeloyl-ACP methyl ester carboxylesterase|nr:alpha/beta hydrolase [Anaerolineae bacterium]
MSVILLDREVIHYESLGRGRPLLMLHSWAGSWRYWIPAMQAACGNFRVYALDLWGFGDSSKNVGRYTFEEQLGLIEHFLAEMGIGRVAVVGHGLGAVLMEVFATAFPERVDRMMSISYPSSIHALQARASGAAPGAIVDWLMERDNIDPAVRIEALKGDVRALPPSLNAIAQMDLNAMTTNTNIARLFVYGARDPVAPPPAQEQLEALPEYAHAIILEESGHYPMIQEVSRFNRLLLDFISLPAGESPRSLQLKEEWKRRVR